MLKVFLLPSMVWLCKSSFMEQTASEQVDLMREFKVLRLRSLVNVTALQSALESTEKAARSVLGSRFDVVMQAIDSAVANFETPACEDHGASSSANVSVATLAARAETLVKLAEIRLAPFRRVQQALPSVLGNTETETILRIAISQGWLAWKRMAVLAEGSRHRLQDNVQLLTLEESLRQLEAPSPTPTKSKRKKHRKKELSSDANAVHSATEDGSESGSALVTTSEPDSSSSVEISLTEYDKAAASASAEGGPVTDTPRSVLSAMAQPYFPTEPSDPYDSVMGSLSRICELSQHVGACLSEMGALCDSSAYLVRDDPVTVSRLSYLKQVIQYAFQQGGALNALAHQNLAALEMADHPADA